MKGWMVLGLAALAVSTVVGCGKSPERVCNKMADLAKDMKDEKKKEPTADEKTKCVEQLTKMKTESEPAYNCTADCVLGASEMKGAMECMGKCPAIEKKSDK
jgi:hypothetical protein